MTSFDRFALRKVLGNFATGVGVITIPFEDGHLGLTINSFTSVSLDPPLVLWCLDQAAHRYEPFAEATGFQISFLRADQRDFSQRFASLEAFVAPDEGIVGAHGLKDAVGRLDCVVHERIEAGDHLIIIGRVTACEAADGDALTYFRGAYGVAS